MLIYSQETRNWEMVWPSRGEDPTRDEAQVLREANRSMLSSERVNVISPWSFTYPTRLRKDD